MQRRKFLQVGGSLAALSTVGLAGCLGDDDDDGAGDPPGTLDWIPAPGALHDSLEYYSTFSTAPATVQEYADQLPSATWQSYQSKWLDWTIASPDASEVKRYIQGNSPDTLEKEEGVTVEFIVVEHELDTDSLAESIREQGFQEQDGHEGFDVYQTSDGTSVRALDDGVLVATLTNDDGRDAAETFIDCKQGNVERYVDSSDTIGTVTDTLETTHNFRFEDFREITNTRSAMGVFEGSIGRGYSTLLEDDQVSAKYVEKFVEDTSIKQSDLDTYTSQDELFENADNLEMNVDGSRIIIDWTSEFGALSVDQLG